MDQDQKLPIDHSHDDSSSHHNHDHEEQATQPHPHDEDHDHDHAVPHAHSHGTGGWGWINTIFHLPISRRILLCILLEIRRHDHLVDRHIFQKRAPQIVIIDGGGLGLQALIGGEQHPLGAHIPIRLQDLVAGEIAQQRLVDTLYGGEIACG